MGGGAEARVSTQGSRQERVSSHGQPRAGRESNRAGLLRGVAGDRIPDQEPEDGAAYEMCEWGLGFQEMD